MSDELRAAGGRRRAGRPVGRPRLPRRRRERRGGDRHRRAPDALQPPAADQGAAARRESSEDELPLEEKRGCREHRVGAGQRPRGRARRRRARPSRSAGGRELGYAHCVLATGAEPTRLPVPGATTRPCGWSARSTTCASCCRACGDGDAGGRDRLGLHRLRDRAPRCDAGATRLRWSPTSRRRTRAGSASRPAERSRGWLVQEGVDVQARRRGRGDRPRRDGADRRPRRDRARRPRRSW